MFFHQTFSFTDLPVVLILLVLECALSFDNAIAISLLIKHLSPKRAKKSIAKNGEKNRQKIDELLREK